MGIRLVFPLAAFLVSGAAAAGPDEPAPQACAVTDAVRLVREAYLAPFDLQNVGVKVTTESFQPDSSPRLVWVNVKSWDSCSDTKGRDLLTVSVIFHEGHIAGVSARTGTDFHPSEVGAEARERRIRQTLSVLTREMSAAGIGYVSEDPKRGVRTVVMLDEHGVPDSITRMAVFILDTGILTFAGVP
jgi:hypothetical protein